MSKWSEPGRWRIVKDDCGHTYIIPGDKEGEFHQWLKTFEESDPEKDVDNASSYAGEDFSNYEIGSHMSCYVFTGTVERG
jgi:hypothetical protein